MLEDLDGRIDAVLDGGSTQHGVESTVLDPNQTPMVIYRPGAITAEQIRTVAGPVGLFHAMPSTQDEPREALPSPGVGLRHYAPRARLVLIETPLADLAVRLAEEAERHASERLGMMLPTEVSIAGIVQRHPDAIVFPWGSWFAPDELAQNLYAGLRTLDAQGCTVIVCPLPPVEGLGAAIHDRLRKAAR